MKLYEKIYTLRTAKNLSQGDLAEMLDVSRQSVSKWETGASIPDLDKLIKMSNLFGVSLDALVREEMPENEQKIAENTPKTPENGENPQNIIIVREPFPTRKTIGLMLLGVALGLFFIVGLFMDFLSGILLSLPFAMGCFCAFASEKSKKSAQTMAGILLFFASVFLAISGGYILAVFTLLMSGICFFSKKYPLFWIFLTLSAMFFLYVALVKNWGVMEVAVGLLILALVVLLVAWLYVTLKKKTNTP